MNALKRSSQVAYKRWKDRNISFVTSQTDDKSVLTVHEEQPGKDEPGDEGVCTIQEQVDLEDSKNRSSGISETFTVEEAVEAIGFGRFQWKLSMLTGVAWVFWALGAVFEVLLAMVVMPTLGWKWLLAFSTFPLVVFAASCCWLPESARFDVLRGREDKALDTLKYIAAANGSSVPTGRLIANIQTDRGRITDLFIPEYRKTTLLVWFIWFCNAFSYYGIVLLTTEMFQAGSACSATDNSNMEPRCSLECNNLTFADYLDLLWTTLAEFPGILITLWMIDRIGRRKSMAICFVLFSVSILPLYACTQRTVLTVFIFIARACITGGWQVAYVYTPEVFPTATRAIGIGTGSGMARVGALITPFIAQVLLKSSVYLTLSVYLICCLLGAVASWVLPMETTGRSLQESTQSTMEQKNMERPHGSETTESSSNTCPQ
ncbi:synaptic vesicle 2-related -like protein [Labeo rohita]|uniref:Synaptic vesicle 2-related-like protein n=1 Tax=Labeo rohita TaxID=84645 RepID=A0A498LRP8_LABRO|nr:synaptic vesicle 2-related -like protein [Labeo rohita]